MKKTGLFLFVIPCVLVILFFIFSVDRNNLISNLFMALLLISVVCLILILGIELYFHNKEDKIVAMVISFRFIGKILIITGFLIWLFSLFKLNSGFILMVIGFILVIILGYYSRTTRYKSYLKKIETPEQKAERIIKENSFNKIGKSIVIGDHLFELELIKNTLIKNNFDITETYKKLVNEREKENEERRIQCEINNIKIREERRKRKEEAERRVYGESKNKRVLLNGEDKEMIFDKFGNKCAICGAKEGLHIHHKNKNPKDNSIENLIVLCGVCHKKVHMNVR